MIDVYSYSSAGYFPAFIGPDWQIAYLNHGDMFADPNQVECHAKTDEAFILLNGNAELLYLDDAETIQLVCMECGKTYNVTAGTWHAIKTYPGAECLIVENSNTHITDVMYRPIP